MSSHSPDLIPIEMLWQDFKPTHAAELKPVVEKSIQLSYLSKSKDTFIENDSSKSESHPEIYYLSKSLKVFGFKYT